MVADAVCHRGEDLPESVRVRVALHSLSSLLGCQVVVADHDAHDRHVRLRCCAAFQVPPQKPHCALSGANGRSVFAADDVHVPDDHMDNDTRARHNVESIDRRVN